MVNLAKGLVKGHIASLDPKDFASSPYCQKNLIPFLQWLLERHKKLGGVTEIRVIADRPSKMVWSGYFTPKHIEQLVRKMAPRQPCCEY